MVVAYLGMDIITHIAFGEPFGFVKQDKDLYNYFANLRLGIDIGMSLAMVPWAMNMLKSRPVIALRGASGPGTNKIMEYVHRSQSSTFSTNKSIKFGQGSYQLEVRTEQDRTTRHARLLRTAWYQSKPGRNRSFLTTVSQVVKILYRRAHLRVKCSGIGYCCNIDTNNNPLHH